MTELFNLKPQKSLRKILRQQGIMAEIRLWSKLRNQALGYKFKRQFGIGKYIVDFYCPRKRLVIEIDGGTHATDREVFNDKIRQKYLENLGLKVIRFTNNDIKEDLEGVLCAVGEACQER